MQNVLLVFDGRTGRLIGPSSRESHVSYLTLAYIYTITSLNYILYGSRMAAIKRGSLENETSIGWMRVGEMKRRKIRVRSCSK